MLKRMSPWILSAIIILLLWAVPHALWDFNVRSVTAEVTGTSGDEIYATDLCGESWVWYEDPVDSQIGDRVEIVFYTFGTEDIYDDEIVEVNKI